MEEQFVPYELAVKLKELGFDEPCFGIYDGRDCKIDSSVNTVYFSNPPYNNEEDSDKHKKYSNSLLYRPSILAPLWQQAFDWFRDKYGYHASFNPYINYSYDYAIYNMLDPHYATKLYCRTNFKTHEKAQITCLEKLIEIVKENELHTKSRG